MYELTTRNMTESEEDFVEEFRKFLSKYRISIQYDPGNVPVFSDENGVGIFLSIHDIYDELYS